MKNRFFSVFNIYLATPANYNPDRVFEQSAVCLDKLTIRMCQYFAKIIKNGDFFRVKKANNALPILGGPIVLKTDDVGVALHWQY